MAHNGAGFALLHRTPCDMTPLPAGAGALRVCCTHP